MERTSVLTSRCGGGAIWARAASNLSSGAAPGQAATSSIELADAGYRVIPIVRRLLADSLTPGGLLRASRREAVPAPSSSNRRNTEVPGAATASSASTPWLNCAPIGGKAELARPGPGRECPRGGRRGRGGPCRAQGCSRRRTSAGLPNLTSGLVGYRRLGCHPPLGARTCAPRPRTRPASRRPTLALATDIAVVDHVSGSVWLIANAVNVDDRPTRADAAYDEAIATAGRHAAQGRHAGGGEARVSVLDRTMPPAPAAASAPPRPSMSAAVGGAEAAHRRRRCAPGGDIPASGYWIRRPTRSTSTACCARSTPARTCISWRSPTPRAAIST